MKTIWHPASEPPDTDRDVLARTDYVAHGRPFAVVNWEMAQWFSSGGVSGYDCELIGNVIEWTELPE